MIRRVMVAALLLVSACHHKKKTVYAADGSCPDPAGCVPPPDYPNEYKAPDQDAPESGPTGEIKQASCDDVGHALASMDLGNWADEDALAPVAAKHRAECVKTKLDQDERQCVFEATDKTGIAYCAPRMVAGAQVALVAAKDCETITTQMRAQTKLYYAEQPIVEKQLLAVEESCAKDRWTVPFGECVRAVPYPGYISAYCSGAAPAPLRKKIESRLAQAK